jgi:hypothetical protein
MGTGLFRFAGIRFRKNDLPISLLYIISVRGPFSETKKLAKYWFSRLW